MFTLNSQWKPFYHYNFKTKIHIPNILKNGKIGIIFLKKKSSLILSLHYKYMFSQTK